MGLYAGMDWTGTTTQNSAIPLFGPCIVAINDLEELNHSFIDLRRKFGMKAGEEFRGSKSSSEKLAAVLEIGMKLNFSVGVLLIDKPNSLILPENKADFVMLSAMRLLHQFLPNHSIQRLWCDQEDLGKTNEHRFKSDIARLGREYASPKLQTSFRPSHHRDLIQLADVVAYVFSWDARKKSDPAVKRLLQKIRNAQQNVIIDPKKWEE